MAVAVTVARSHVDVQMTVRHAVVRVRVAMKPDRASRAQKRVAAEPDEHDGDEGLHERVDLGRNTDLHDGRDHRRHQQRACVPDAPERPDDTGAVWIAVLPDEGGHGRDMVGIERVAQPEQEPDTQRGGQRSIHRKRSIDRRSVHHNGAIRDAAAARRRRAASHVGDDSARRR